jgi:predicted nucleic acid-binding protein
VEVLLDTSGLVAGIDRADSNHARAIAIRNGLLARRWRVMMTSFILAETHALLLNRLSRQSAVNFLRDMESGVIPVEWVTPADVDRARQIIYQYQDKRFSLTDATSFAVMERLNIPYAFSFDNNFLQYGLNVLTPEFFTRREQSSLPDVRHECAALAVRARAGMPSWRPAPDIE